MDTNPEVTPDPVFENKKVERKAYSLYDMARRLLLAGIGAMAVTYDEMEEFVDRLVERGELAKQDGETLLNEVRERRRKALHGEGGYFRSKREEFFNRMSVPSKKDFDELSTKLTILERKIDELTRSRTENP